MRAVICRDWGGPGSLVVGDTTRPEPGPGEVAIDVAAAALNFADTLITAGKYQIKPPLPFIPGFEVSGTVAALGDGVTGLAEGTRVMAVMNYGGFAERTTVPAQHVYPIPDSLDNRTAAAFPVMYGTAHIALERRGALRPGETLLVHGAAGGVGLAAVEVGKAMGARVIAAAGTPEKVAVALDHGADHGIDTSAEDIREAVLALTDDGADVVFDPVGGAAFRASLRCVAWGGRLLIIGFAGGEIPKIPANILLVKSVAAVGVHWNTHLDREPALLARTYKQLLAWAVDGRLRPRIGAVYDLAEVAAAMEDLRSRRVAGKIVLEVRPTAMRS